MIEMLMYVASKIKFPLFLCVSYCLGLYFSKLICEGYNFLSILGPRPSWPSGMVAGRNPVSAKCSSSPEFDSRRSYIFPDQLYFLFVCLFVCPYLFIYLFIYKK